MAIFRPRFRSGRAVDRSPKETVDGKLGSRNRATLLADALLEGEQEELVRKGIELAKAGDPQMLKFFLDKDSAERTPCKDRPSPD